MFEESAPTFDSLTTVEGSSLFEQLRDNNQILAQKSEEKIQDIIRKGE